MTFTNVKISRCKHPRKIGDKDYFSTLVKKGAGVVVVCGVELGEYAMVGSGAVVTKDVPAHALVVGNSARQIGWACICGEILDETIHCSVCERKYRKQEIF